MLGVGVLLPRLWLCLERPVGDTVSLGNTCDLGSEGVTYGLGYVIDDDCAVCVTVIHGREGFVAFLSSCIPYFKLDGSCVVEGDGLGEEGSADC